MISIVTGTLNRMPYLEGLLENTIHADDRIELVLVDGGSNDGTCEYLRDVAESNSRLKFIEVGGRSPYPHYMNLGVKRASHELICQWNDDVLLCGDWQSVIDVVDDDHDAYLFNWKLGDASNVNDPQWLKCDGMRDNGWIIINNAEYDYPEARGEQEKEICLNYGVYKKQIFRDYGLYNNAYKFYCADAEMAIRAHRSGAKFKTCFDIKVAVLPAEKRAVMYQTDIRLFDMHAKMYLEKRPVDVFDGEFLS